MRSPEGDAGRAVALTAFGDVCACIVYYDAALVLREIHISRVRISRAVPRRIDWCVFHADGTRRGAPRYRTIYSYYILPDRFSAPQLLADASQYTVAFEGQHSSYR